MGWCTGLGFGFAAVLQIHIIVVPHAGRILPSFLYRTPYVFSYTPRTGRQAALIIPPHRTKDGAGTEVATGPN